MQFITNTLSKETMPFLNIQGPFIFPGRLKHKNKFQPLSP